jgi:hypothetical protein
VGERDKLFSPRINGMQIVSHKSPNSRNEEIYEAYQGFSKDFAKMQNTTNKIDFVASVNTCIIRVR